MGIFNFFKKDKIENENTSKPFHQNKNNAERKDWFARTRPWHKIDSSLVDALINKYNDNPMFEVFVITSMENNLVTEYENLSQQNIDPSVACCVISGILFKHGAKYSAQVGAMFKKENINERKLSAIYGNAMNLLESSIIIDPNQIDSYIQLAGLQGMLNKNENALQFIDQGLDAIKFFKESKVPFEKSNIPEIRNSEQHLDTIEKMLLTMKNEFS